MSRALRIALLVVAACGAAPAHAATVGPTEELPAAQGMGREAFPVDPIGRTWRYVRPDGTRVRREIRKWDYECIDRMLVGIDCYERALATVAIGTDGAAGHERVLTVDACGDQWVRHALDWRDPGGEWTSSVLERAWFPFEFPLRTGLSWDDASNDVDLLKRKEETGPVKPDTRYRVLGKASVGVIAGRFPITVVVESTPIQSSAPPARRVFYAANVGPVLEQAQDATGTWITDFELESYEAKPATVFVHSDEVNARTTARTAVRMRSLSGQMVSAGGWIQGFASIPPGVTYGEELLALTPQGRKWVFRRARSASTEERVVWDPRNTLSAGSLAHPNGTCTESFVGGATMSYDDRFFVCKDGIWWQHGGSGLVRSETQYLPSQVAGGSHWSNDTPGLGEPHGDLIPLRSHHLLGRARVVTPAGSFEDAVLIETAEPAHGDTPARAVRRTYYAANVGPVLVLVPEPDGRWVADLVLESIVVPPPTVPPKAQP